MLLIVRVTLLVTSLFGGLEANAKPFFTEIQPKSIIRVESEGKPVEESKNDDPRAAAAASVAATIVMMDIPGGEFLMGSANGLADERPVHKVKVRPFRLGKFEVTFEQYDAYCQAMLAKCPDDGRWGRGPRPVVNVTWEDANGFIEWLNAYGGKPFRLPTEAEWEYAARARTKTDYFWGRSMMPGMANCDDSCADAFVNTAPVGSFKPNRFGLHDMLGNVWEWTQDCYNDSYVDAPADGSAWTAGACDVRVVRGGSWASGFRWLRVSDREWEHASNYNGTRSRGFRLAQDR